MKITLTKLGTKNLATLGERTINSSKKGEYTVVAGNPLLQKVEDEYALYGQVYSKLSYSGKGKAVAAMDLARDNAYSGIRNYVLGFEGVPSVPGFAEAADIAKVFEDYGKNILTMNYAEETAQLKKLFEQLDKPENTAKLAVLHLETAYADFKQKQQDFETAYAQQAEANADLRTLPSASAIRQRLEKALRDYYDLLTAMKDVSGWEMIYADINEIVKAAVQSNRDNGDDDEVKAP